MITVSDIRNEVEQYEDAYNEYATKEGIRNFDEYLDEVVKITNDNQGDENDAIAIIEDTMNQFGIEA